MSADRWVSSSPLVDGPTLRCTGEESYTAITSPDFCRKLHPSELHQTFRDYFGARWPHIPILRGDSIYYQRMNHPEFHANAVNFAGG
jgi:hypothetical protein